MTTTNAVVRTTLMKTLGVVGVVVGAAAGLLANQIGGSHHLLAAVALDAGILGGMGAGLGYVLYRGAMELVEEANNRVPDYMKTYAKKLLGG